MKIPFSVLVLGTASILIQTIPVNAMTLKEYLGLVRSQNGIFEALKSEQEAAESRPDQGDLELSPFFTSKVFYLDDYKQPLTSGFQSDHTKSYGASLGLAKQFSTGTALSVDYGSTRTQLWGLPVAYQPRAWQGVVGVGLKQSLWKNAFGSATRERQNRETLTQKLELLSVDAKSKQTLVDAEAAFWNLQFATQDLELKKEALELAHKLQSWMQKRVTDGLSDRSDLLQVEALVSLRQLELIGAEDHFRSTSQRVRDFIQASTDETITVSAEEDLSRVRDLPSLSENGNSVVRVDAKLKQLESQVKTAASLEVDNLLSPDLELQGAYHLNSKDPKTNPLNEPKLKPSLTSFGDPQKSTFQVQLSFSLNLDQGGLDRARSVSRSEARASEVLAARAIYESRSSWSEMKRQHSDLSRRIEVLETLEKTQREKATREQDRLARGRTTTSQVVNFEQEATEARANLLKLRAEQRKLEAMAQLYVGEG
jgi:outer membrane protein TolC